MWSALGDVHELTRIVEHLPLEHGDAGRVVIDPQQTAATLGLPSSSGRKN
jgi:hypothetical protein